MSGTTTMKYHKIRHICILLALVALALQSCFGGSNTPSSNFNPIDTNGGGPSVGVNSDQHVFNGKIYFTVNHVLYVIDGSGKAPLRLTPFGTDVRDPAVSPNGKWIIFDVRSKNYSELVFMASSGGTLHVALTGNGKFYQDGPFIHSNFYWFAQPQWSADSQSVLFLSDLQKNFFWGHRGLGPDFDNSPFVDMQVFEVPLQNPPTPQEMSTSGSNVIAYADFGDGGNRDPAFRPGHPTEIIYTHYTYDSTRTNQVIQIYLADATAIANHPELHYHPGEAGNEFDSGVPLTPATIQTIEPAFSPNGNFIAYIRRETNSQMSLYVMPVAEGATNNPTDPKVQQAALQPYKKSSLILQQQFISQPVWSPDGKQIVYLSYNNNTFDLWLANVAIDPKTGGYKMQGSPIQLTTGGIDGDSRAFWTA